MLYRESNFLWVMCLVLDLITLVLKLRALNAVSLCRRPHRGYWNSLLLNTGISSSVLWQAKLSENWDCLWCSVQYGKILETSVFMNRSADFVWMLIVVCVTMLVDPNIPSYTKTFGPSASEALTWSMLYHSIPRIDIHFPKHALGMEILRKPRLTMQFSSDAIKAGRP